MAAIERCWDVTEAHVAAAIGSRREMAALLEQMVAVAQPEAGAAKILIVLARMADGSCDWLEGSLRIELETLDKGTMLSVMEDLGGGVRERVFPRFRIHVPLEEFERGLRMAPRAIEPLHARMADGKVVLTPGKTRRSNHPPPSFVVAEDCLRKSLPPKVRKTLSPPKPAPAPVAPRRSRPAKEASPAGMMFEIPRAPKTLDLSDLTGSTPREARPAPALPKTRGRAPVLRRRSVPPKKP